LTHQLPIEDEHSMFFAQGSPGFSKSTHVGMSLS